MVTEIDQAGPGPGAITGWPENCRWVNFAAIYKRMRASQDLPDLRQILAFKKRYVLANGFHSSHQPIGLRL